MQLTRFSDYSLRVLLYAASRNGQLVTIAKTAEVYDISRTHLMKVVNFLINSNYLIGTRGKHGGFKLAKRPEDMTIGGIVRHTEQNFHLVECFSPDNRCRITPRCKLKGIIGEALESFLKVLDQYTLADLLKDEWSKQPLELFEGLE